MRSKSVPKMAGSTRPQSSCAALRRMPMSSCVEIEDGIVAGAEEAAVEVVNGGEAEIAVAGGHGGKELFEPADECLGLLAVGLNGFAEEILGKQADAVGKEAKQQLHDKAGHCLVVGVARPQVVLELGELLGRLLRDADFERAGLELFGFLKDGAEDFERRQIGAGDGRGAGSDRRA